MGRRLIERAAEAARLRGLHRPPVGDRYRQAFIAGYAAKGGETPGQYCLDPVMFRGFKDGRWAWRRDSNERKGGAPMN